MKKIILSIFLASSFCSYAQSDNTKFSKLVVSLAQCVDSTSDFYFKKIEEKFINRDTSMTAEQVLSLTKYYAYTLSQNLVLLDSLSGVVYKLNENENFTEAIMVAKSILNVCPNNLTAHKEIALAYKKSGNDSLSKEHFGLMVKILTSIFRYGDGQYDHPFIINNFFEGVSIYEIVFRTTPSKVTLMLDKHMRLLGSYYAYSSSVDNIIISYSDLTHWKTKLKKGDYIEEGKE